MYKLGTTLIFTELAEAAAAARLFGVYALQTQEGKGWSDKFSSVVEKGWETWQAETWRIILDTEEKCGWFVPRMGDTVLAWCYPDANPQPPAMEVVHILGEHDSDWCTWDVTPDGSKVKRIIERQGKPFPTPQEVIEPEETL